MVDTLHKLGFVGFGAMPQRMAVRLRDASHSVIAYDAAHDGGEVKGFRLTCSPAALAGQVDALLVAVRPTMRRSISR